jgi:hypothetical protein
MIMLSETSQHKCIVYHKTHVDFICMHVVGIHTLLFFNKMQHNKINILVQYILMHVVTVHWLMN